MPGTGSEEAREVERIEGEGARRRGRRRRRRRGRRRRGSRRRRRGPCLESKVNSYQLCNSLSTIAKSF